MVRWWPLTFCLLTLSLYGQGDQVWIHPNRGQWDERVSYKVELHQGEMLIEPTAFTYQFYDFDPHNHNEHTPNDHPETVKSHALRARFLDAQPPQTVKEQHPSPFYRNYFLSNDQSRWKSEVHSVTTVRSEALYPGIDLLLEGGDASLKYSWIVAPGADASRIRWAYDGADSLSISASGELVVEHSLGAITEGKPVAWLLKDGKKKPLPIRYALTGNVLTFAWNGAQTFDDTLVIDPSLTFSTFTGSTADNWGFTASPDPNNGSLFAGGIVFGPGYPLTTGAFDNSFNGGESSGFQIDVGITKFNATGTALLYSTYLGGNNNETPHSIVSNANGELFVLGVTGSNNFPMAGTPFDNTFNSGPFLSNVNGLNFNGTDLYIVRFNAAGTALLASTYVGGSGTDGINNNGTLHFNYGDQFRGEIIVDANNVYVSSVTTSGDFPVQNPSQATLAGVQDAVVFKMNQSLSAMQWSTYFGGAGAETGNGIQLSSTGNVYVAGGTTSSTMPFASGFDLSYNGGVSDGYVARFNGANGAPLSGTYIGTGEYDQTYFVQLDLDDQVYVYGQTEGTLPVSPGCYGIPNSGQFVAKYGTNLATQEWNTVIGAGTGHVEISPTAFLVSNCKDIYLSGWGGTVNQNGSQADFSSSNGFPVTSDAFQSTTNGSNFWIAVLDNDASLLKYATFMGGVASSSNHVDGGTSRFDKNGSIYHAVCGACGGNDNGFTTTQHSWSPTNQSANCNLAAFKFELSSIEAVIGDPDPVVCLPDPVIFQNNSSNGNEFLWDFGDNTTSTEINPTHLYAGPGEYTVTLIVSDTNECFTPDSVEFVVYIGDFQGGIVAPANSICPGASYQFEAYGGSTYAWQPANLLNNPNIFNPVATIDETTTFTCIISDTCGIDTVQVTLNVLGGNVQISNDTSVCIGESVQLETQGIVTATWTPATYLDNPNSLNPVSTPETTTTYTVTGTTADGCQLNEQVTITVFFNSPEPVMADTLRYCSGLGGAVVVSGAETYAWSPPVDITPVTGPNVFISTATEQYYYCDFTNACGTERDSIYVDLIVPEVTAGNDTTVCPGQRVFLHADGGVSYTWYPAVTFLDASGSLVSALPGSNTVYKVVGQDTHGCYDSAFVAVTLFPQPFIQTCPDVFAFIGDQIQLSATSTTQGPYVWSPGEYLSCVVCSNPVASPDQNYVYTVSYTDANGCTASDQVKISYDPIIYVPNAFTPDGNGVNNDFFAQAGNIKTLEMQIFNRWGELIYSGGGTDRAWDGTYNGRPCPDGVYTWKIKYTDMSDTEHELVGHVSLLR